MIFYLAYTSRRTIPSLSIAERKAMIDRSRMRNDQNGITGVIIVHDGYFTQLIEGSKKAVLRLWENIQKDTRHIGLEKLFEGEEQQRMFEGWPLKYEIANCASIQTDLEIYNEIQSDMLSDIQKPITAHLGPKLLGRYLKQRKKKTS